MVLIETEASWIEVLGNVMGFVGTDGEIAVVNVIRWRKCDQAEHIPWTYANNDPLPMYALRWIGHDYTSYGESEDQLLAGDRIRFNTNRIEQYGYISDSTIAD